MPLDPALAGRAFAPTAPYTVGREKLAEFRESIGAAATDDDETAPLTFPIVVAFRAMTQLMTDPDVGIELRNIVHRDQRFEQVRPIRAGDELVATLTVETLRAAAGMDVLGTRTEIATIGGEPVATAFATLVHRGPGT
ncbi:MAG: FAS1-like dehydratase domain-containing protein [Nocardioidaceae bacterium]